MHASIDLKVIERLAATDDREPTPRSVGVISYLSTAEVADCTCPEWCERDHDRD